MRQWRIFSLILFIWQEGLFRGRAALRDAEGGVLVRPAKEQDLEGSVLIRRLLLVSGADGVLYALDKYSGALLWTNDELGGSLISTSRKSQEATGGPVYLVEPQDDGALYAYIPEVGMKRLPLTVRQLVEQSPIRWPDGSFFVGRKVTHCFALDLATGQLVARYEWGAGAGGGGDEMGAPEAKVSEAFSGRSHSLILISRTEFSLSCFNPASPEDALTPSWQLSFAQYGGFVSPFGGGTTARGSEAPYGGASTSPRHEQILYSSINGIIAARDSQTMRLMWIRKIPAVALAFFRLNESPPGEEAMGPILMNVPIARISATSAGAGEQIARERSPGEGQVTVTVGEHAGHYFVLPRDQFPVFRQSFNDALGRRRLLTAAEVASDGDGTLAVVESAAARPRSLPTTAATAHSGGEEEEEEEEEGAFRPGSCYPGSPDFPLCLLGDHMAEVLRPVPLLSAGEEGTRWWWFGGGRLWDLLPRPRGPYLVSGLVVLLTTVLLLWQWYRRWARRSVARPVAVEPSLIGLRPPGFEEISLGSADIFYHAQSEEGSSERSPPRSFTVTDEVIGYGSHGTVVFKGYYDGVPVAVKRMLANFYELAGHEVSLLQQSDHHPNVIRYHCRERTEKFTYIVLELCTCSLADIIEGRGATTGESFSSPPLPPEIVQLQETPQRLLEQMTQGLAHLHELKLVHRDIKPHNILITPKGRLVISDFGLSKKLAEDQSFFNPTMQSGTVGWRAPECILGEEAQKLAQLSERRGPGTGAPSLRLSRSVDIFALGCVFYYVLSGGEHPFGGRLHREMNIISDKVDLSRVQDKPEAYDLISRMLDRRPERRPTSEQVLKHPYFWSAQKQVAFLQDLSDKFEIEDRKSHSTILDSFEMRRRVIFEGKATWNRLLDAEVWQDLCAYRKYNPQSARDLLRALRNKRSHFHELSSELKAILGDTPEAFMGYFLKRFPRLLIECYHLVECTELRDENPFAAVYL